MKQLLAALTIMTCICITSAAMAGGVKAPKEICLEVASNSVFCLAVKSLGSIELINKQKLQHYIIAGSFYQGGQHHPIGGTGFMDNNIFRFHISGQFMGNPSHHSVDGYVNLAVEPATGSMSGIFTSEGNPVVQDSYPLAEVTCSGVNAPDDAVPLTDPAESMYGK
jgi:hypothetical protein